MAIAADMLLGEKKQVSRSVFGELPKKVEGEAIGIARQSQRVLDVRRFKHGSAKAFFPRNARGEAGIERRTHRLKEP